MDWLKLFAFLVAVASIPISAEGPKKKIRIHLPEKVKHIHHHKKIYITNHPAASQYAPAYVPNAESSVAVPTSVALPANGGYSHYNSIELYDENQHPVPSAAPTVPSKLLPLYNARGYYGPKPSDYEDQDYDLVPPPEPSENSYATAAYPPLPPPTSAPIPPPPKRVKILKVNEAPRKKVIRKKPKRVVIRNRPKPQEDEHPVSSFHEHFYSDLEGSGTIRRIKKPPRVEKIIDGDTEHIHTYSEEHIHKIVYDDAKVVGVDNIGSMSALAPSPALLPIKAAPGLVAIAPELYAGLTPVSAPSHFTEYAAYNPREVTHDHIFHDHGELPVDVDAVKNGLGSLGYPKASFNSHGLRLNGRQQQNNKRMKNTKYNQKYQKTINTPITNDYSTYYNALYGQNLKQKRVKPGVIAPVPVPAYDMTNQAFTNQVLTNQALTNQALSNQAYDDYRPAPRYKEITNKIPPKTKNYPTQSIATPYYGNTKQVPSYQDYRQQQSSAPAPFQISSTVVHEYEPKGFTSAASAPTGYNTKYKDPLLNFKDTYANNFEYDAFASSSTLYANENKNEGTHSGKKSKKSSVSSQNIKFGRQDHQSIIDHLDDATGTINDEVPSAIENFDDFDQSKPTDSVASPTAYTIKETSPAHQYYTAMALKALNTEQLAEASNHNYQYVEAPTMAPSPTVPSAATTATTIKEDIEDEESQSEGAAEVVIEPTQQNKKVIDKKPEGVNAEQRKRHIKKTAKNAGHAIPNTRHHEAKFTFDSLDPTLKANLKYGDKI